MSNDQQTQLPPTSDESAAAAPTAHAARKLEQPATWPGNVPSQAQALEVLCGRRTLVMSLPNARKLQEKLTLPEREALLDEGLADALREAVAVRWRLAAAQDLLLTAGGRVDQAALQALLAEVDRALEALRAANPSSPDMGLAIDRTWETLTQEAVDFSSNVKAASAQTAAAPAHAHAAPKKPTATAGKVTFQTEDPDQQGKQGTNKALLIILGVAVLLVGAYHGANIVRDSQPQSAADSYPGAPPDTVVISGSSNGSLLMRSTRLGPLSAEQQAWLKQQEAKGMEVKPQGSGSYLLVPAAKAPATAGNTQP
ncbi:hypothetical protein [Archangium lansingense]|uniref:Uncharacterized protein n=1 Tax=Archangium lansingense TaxID=2995310 RepID=A0ABT4AC84_9BACT|nr:hypothetical protein [Archangium lansinium]MCY1078844.1 hypothetical protein [Archangium lansinium]